MYLVWDFFFIFLHRAIKSLLHGCTLLQHAKLRRQTKLSRLVVKNPRCSDIIITLIFICFFSLSHTCFLRLDLFLRCKVVLFIKLLKFKRFYNAFSSAQKCSMLHVFRKLKATLRYQNNVLVYLCKTTTRNQIDASTYQLLNNVQRSNTLRI